MINRPSCQGFKRWRSKGAVPWGKSKQKGQRLKKILIANLDTGVLDENVILDLPYPFRFFATGPQYTTEHPGKKRKNASFMWQTSGFSRSDLLALGHLKYQFPSNKSAVLTSAKRRAGPKKNTKCHRLTEYHYVCSRFWLWFWCSGATALTNLLIETVGLLLWIVEEK